MMEFYKYHKMPFTVNGWDEGAVNQATWVISSQLLRSKFEFELILIYCKSFDIYPIYMIECNE